MQLFAVLKSIICERKNFKYIRVRRKEVRKMKRFVALVLSLCMVFTMCITAGAADDKGLTEAVKAVKAVIDIPEEYSEFNYRTIQNESGYIWSLQWSSENGEVYVRINQDGEILSYSENSYTNDDGQWAKITCDEAKQMAQDFAKKVDPKLFENLVFVSQRGNGRNVGFEFAESKNGIKLYNRGASVYIDRVSKKVRSYSSDGISKKDAQSAEKVISYEDAVKALNEKIGSELVYKKKYDYKDKKITTYPAYVLNDSYLKAISALDGSVVEYEYSEGNDELRGGGGTKSDSTLNDENGDFKENALTKEEIAAVESVSGLISKEKAEQTVKNAFAKAADLKMETAELYKDIYSDKYVWNINFRQVSEDKSDYRSAWANVDAKSGEILGYNYWGSGEVKSTVDSEDKAKAAALNFLNTYAKQRTESCFELRGENNNVKAQENGENTYYFYADRKANGIRVEGEGIRIAVAADASISSYSMDITDLLSFDDVSGAMSSAQAYENFAKHANMELIYVYANGKYTPVYDLENKYVSLNPFTGEVIKERGIEENDKAPEAYTDIDGHWAKDVINSLLDNGYYISGSEFEPDKAISVREFLTYAKFMYPTETEDEFKAYIANVEPEKKAADLGIDINAPLTRETAAKYFVYDSGNYDIAKYSEIFKYPFADEANVLKENIGFIAICGARKIFSGDENGNFNPQKTMTRAEAAAAIYNYYSAK